MSAPSVARHRIRWKATVALAGALVGPASAVWAAQAPQDIVAVVKRIQEAAQRRSFVGTYVVSHGGHMTSSRITHFCDGRDQIERIEALDGQMRQVYRHNDTVHVLWPGSRTALVEQRELVGRFPAPLQPGDGTQIHQYELQVGGDERVAGHDAQVVLFKPRDALRYPRRLWLERRTGLLLRSDLLNERGDVLESASFSELQINVRLSAQTLLQEMNRLDGYRVNRPVYLPTSLDSEGWTMRPPVAGFETLQVVRRPMAPWIARTAASGVSDTGPAADNAMVLQAVYSDGLTHVSVFIEPFVAALHKRGTPATIGSTSALSHRQGEWWITAVGAVPVAALQQFVGGLERRKP
ncbi:MucB/RseB C-terminal domain-containing protein [Sphaerotilus montanus]|jgi:sigma-E factor negative regulatory protein RseB|uniref:Sigma-E factor negative regulatory protein RseB n=1 Tax=Sphaerotilus montanus TaxID=522889 RepID=A0A7Y9U5S3_9BURK|nr:MucB/RseB C-terminal domain-containing protein [Sphaerotilus montanus]NYG31887.1 sigma-E factor negative regulatory protein RseB [Sphaerotilus montanus]NZD59151.1 MucB/RseB C-terminal domain-containing protein [Sphaerotilus montanus]